MTPKNCAKCGEDAYCVRLAANKYFVRVRRISKCKGYRPPAQRYGFTNRDGTCQTDVCMTEQQALEAWASKFAAVKMLEGKR